MDRLLRGDIPPDGNCDVTTLARRGRGVDRTAFYRTRPTPPERRIRAPARRSSAQAGTAPDPRDAQIEPASKHAIDKLRTQISPRP